MKQVQKLLQVFNRSSKRNYSELFCYKWKIEIEQELSKLSLGGIAGTSNAIIRNSYTRNISFDVNKAIIVNGIGGIVGENTGTIQYCYSQGEIVTTKEKRGELQEVILVLYEITIVWLI